MGKKKRKYSLKKIIALAIVFATIILIGIYADKAQKEAKAETIAEGYEVVYAVVEKQKRHTLKGKRFSSRTDILYLFYEKNDTIFHIIKYLPDGKLEDLDIKINDCFEIKVATSNDTIFEVNFNEKRDTIIDKKKFKYHNYQTTIHKNIIE